MTQQFSIQIKYNVPAKGWPDVERFIIDIQDVGWSSQVVQQRLHNWLVAYFYNFNKGNHASRR